ncbi:MAG: formylglycine-generating enzyme family protein, partial [Verrucomicrobiales bacterium]
MIRNRILLGAALLLLAAAAPAQEAPPSADDTTSPAKPAPADKAAPAGMVWIKGGSFAMGSPDADELARAVEQPAHEVTVSGCWIDETEVTN